MDNLKAFINRLLEHSEYLIYMSYYECSSYFDAGDLADALKTLKDENERLSDKLNFIFQAMMAKTPEQEAAFNKRFGIGDSKAVDGK